MRSTGRNIFQSLRRVSKTRGNWWNNFKQQGNLRKLQFAYGYPTSTHKKGKTCPINNSWRNICSTLTDSPPPFISVMKIEALLISIELKMCFKLNYLTLCILQLTVSLGWTQHRFPCSAAVLPAPHCYYWNILLFCICIWGVNQKLFFDLGALSVGGGGGISFLLQALCKPFSGFAC